MNMSVADEPVARPPASATVAVTSVEAGQVDGGQAVGQPVASVSVIDVAVENLSPNPHQPRRQFDETSIRELADSLRTTGMIQPVVARLTDSGGFELIAGERRWRAAKIAGLTTLPVILKKVDPIMQAQMALVENLQRQNLNPIERANAYKSLLDNLGLTHAELADRLGEDRSVIGHHLRLLDLPPDVQALIADSRLTVGHGKVLAGVSDPAQQTRLAGLAVDQGLNIRNLERLVGAPATTSPSTSQPSKPASAHLQDLEKTLARQLGMRVQIHSGKKKGNGRLVLHFASLDQFDDLMARLGLASE